MQNEFRIHTALANRYQILDLSGALPFSIVIGLCGRSPADTDTRPVRLDIAGSVLDIPYALTHGLLVLYEQRPESLTNNWIPVDLRHLEKAALRETEFLVVPSRNHWTESWRHSFTIYHASVDISSSGWVSVLELGKRYRIKLASGDLVVRDWMYVDQDRIIDNEWKPSSGDDCKAVKLVNSKGTTGSATFQVRESLPMPPRLETKLRLCTNTPSFGFEAVDAESHGPAIEICTTNIDSESVTIQTRGRQHFLLPWSVYQPEPDADHGRARFIDGRHCRPPIWALQVVDSKTDDVLWEQKERFCCTLTGPNYDPRPKIENVLILKPWMSVSRMIDIQEIVSDLGDGSYKLRLQRKGCRWWRGEIGEEEGDNGRVSKHLGGTLRPPLILESQDEVEFEVREGEVLQNKSDDSIRPKGYSSVVQLSRL